jgi:hypothetical protein
MDCEADLSSDHHLGHDAMCDGCRETISGIRHQCLICPDWNYCDDCITQAPRKHARHEFAVIPEPRKARNITVVQSQALDFGRLQTRFLTIASSPFSSNLPTEESIRVSCECGIKSLYECPEYIALSYSWGDHNSTRPILLDGYITWVTTSLEAALQELIARGVRTVWVDAVCIDQGNNYEKVYQLRQMGTIFSQAVKVIAWLGPAAEDSDNAMEALSQMFEVEDMDCHSAAIMQLLKRQYWERVWIIQELAKASSVEVWCGTQMLPWDTFIEGVQNWWSTSKLRVSDFDHPVFTLKHFCDAELNIRRGSARMLLSTAMFRTLHTKATLERDRIYALLGIARDGAETVSTPNYVQSDAKVFKSIFKHMIVEQGQLDLILLAGLGRNRADSPSWLPDRMPVKTSPWILKCFEGPPDKKDVVVCHENVLAVKGQILGQIRSETGYLTVPYALPELDYTIRYLYYVAQQLWICGFFGHAAISLDFSSETCARVLSAFWSLPAEGDRVRCPKLRQWFEETAETLHRTSLRCSVKTVREWQLRKNFFPPIAEPLEDPDHWSWLEKLEASIASMIRHGFRIQKLDNHKLVIVPVGAKALDFVAHIANCLLPVVLRKSSDGMYNMVGEVVDTLAWYQKGPSDFTEENEFGMTLQNWHKKEDMEWRTLHLI